jgi:hypothetical protein
LTGQSSVPETLRLEPRGRGVLDPPAAVADIIKTDVALWGKVVKDAGIIAD